LNQDNLIYLLFNNWWKRIR